MKFVLDTNAVSALMKGEARFIERLKQRSKGEVGVPQPALAEIAYGIERLPQSKRRESLRERFDLVRGELARSSWTDEVSECFWCLPTWIIWNEFRASSWRIGLLHKLTRQLHKVLSR